MKTKEPLIRVGIMTAGKITVVFHGAYTVAGRAVEPDVPVVIDASVPDGTEYEPAGGESDFEVLGVTIGVNFHWERRENQRFRGAAAVIHDGDGVTLVNIIGAEQYLMSVISSEMSATASEEFLKAHAVISRSWLFARINPERRRSGDYSPCTRTADTLVRWYDHTEHERFDVCADDHCQRYQGIMRQTTPVVRRAVEATRGQVLMYDGELVDTRFSKCCGGVLEEFENCWEPVHHACLEAARDSVVSSVFPDLRIEENARKWILSRPDALCAHPAERVIAQVLNGYDRETTDFYRWVVEYDRDTISQIVRTRTGIDFGYIMDLVPLQRGTSGRISMLLIKGTRRSMTIGKELEIRRTLSSSHLYSSAFVVERADIDADGVPGRILLHGAGWGHGVGLCQIGAAVMGDMGYDYSRILLHYYSGAEIKKLY